MGLLFSVSGLLALTFGYLLGSIPFGLVVTRLAGRGDIRSIGSGNIGATNVLRTGSKGLAAATLLLDGFKGTLAVLLVTEVASRWAGLHAFEYGYIAGFGAFLGHLFPVWLGFRGGKGVATYIGVLIGVNGFAALIFCAVWAVTAAATRFSSLAGLVGTVIVLLFYLVSGWGGWTAFAYILAMTVLIFYKHEGNIRRLLAGEESQIGARS